MDWCRGRFEKACQQIYGDDALRLWVILDLDRRRSDNVCSSHRPLTLAQNSEQEKRKIPARQYHLSVSPNTYTTHMSSPAPSSGWPAWLSHYASTLYHSGMPALFWVRPHWTDKQMTSQSGKVSARRVL